jgi:hypothetical protein
VGLIELSHHAVVLGQAAACSPCPCRAWLQAAHDRVLAGHRGHRSRRNG